MRTVLVIANETIGGKPLVEAVRRYAAEEESRFVLCVPQTQPRAGYVVYDDSVFDAAQTRVDLAAAYRLAVLYGWTDLNNTHFSARIPGTDHFLLNPFGTTVGISRIMDAQKRASIG